MPYATRQIAPPQRGRVESFAGLGADAADPRHGTTAEREAYHSRLRWRREQAHTGPRRDEWWKQAEWATLALRRLIAGEPVDVRPFPTDPELLALIVNGRSWLLTLPEWQLLETFPGLTPTVLARARRILLPGDDVVAIARAKVEADIPVLEQTLARLRDLHVELNRYAVFAEATLKQFQTYAQWFERHLKHKEQNTAVVGAVLSAIATALYWIPVVGWALGAAVDAANVAYQLDRMKAAIAAMQAAGARVAAANVYVALMEALVATKVELENALAATEWMLYLSRAQREVLDAIRRPAVGGASSRAGIAPPAGVVSPTAASDTSIIRALLAEGRRAVQAVRALSPGQWIAGAAVATAALVVALLGRKRRP